MKNWKRKEYSVWSGMKSRCNANNKAAKYYAGRGIGVCDGLKKFPHFFSIMGKRPSPRHTIDRIDNNRGYECGCCDDCQQRGATRNVRWATRRRQQRNRNVARYVVYQGQRCYLPNLARRRKMRHSMLWNRIFVLGWSVREALLIPPGMSRYIRNRKRIEKGKFRKPIPKRTYRN